MLCSLIYRTDGLDGVEPESNVQCALVQVADASQSHSITLSVTQMLLSPSGRYIR